jgi:hypothetical protein
MGRGKCRGEIVIRCHADSEQGALPGRDEDLKRSLVEEGEEKVNAA